MRCALSFALVSTALLSACPLPDYRYPPGAPEIDAFTAIPFDVPPGGSTELSWKTRGADRVTLLGEVVASEGSKMLSFTATTTVELIAENLGGTSRARVDVRVVDPQPVEIELFTAAPTKVSPGEVVTLSWRTANATRVSLSFSTGEVIMRDAEKIGSLSLRSDTDFGVELRAEGFMGPKIEARTVSVEQRIPVINAFYVDPPIVTPPANPELVWEVQQAHELRITEHFDSGDEYLLYVGPATFGSGRLPLSSDGGSRTIRLEATSPAGTSIETTRLLVLEARPPEIAELTLSPSENGPGGMSLLRWSTRYADLVLLSVDGDPAPVDPQGAMWLTFDHSTTVQLTASSAFADSSVSRSVDVFIDPLRPAIELFVSPQTAEIGQEAIISWNTERAERIRFVTDGGLEVFSSIEPVGNFSYAAPAPLILLAIADNLAGETVRAVPILFVSPPVILDFYGPPVARAGRPAEFGWVTSGAHEGDLISPSPGYAIHDDIERGSYVLYFEQARETEVSLIVNSSVVYGVTATLAVSVLPSNFSLVSLEPDNELPTANGPYFFQDFDDTFLTGDLETGDTDMFAFTIPENGRIRAELSGLDACSIPVALDVYEEYPDRGTRGLVGTYIDVSCEHVDAQLDPAIAGMAGNAVIAVRADSFDPRSDSYVLRVSFDIKSCGDGIRDRGEDCDDGNNVPGDGCSACLLENLDEIEPNLSEEYANEVTVGVPFRAYLGDDDRDFFRFVLTPDRAGPVRVSLAPHLEATCPRATLYARPGFADEVSSPPEEGCAELSGPEMVLGPGVYVIAVYPGSGLSRDVRGTYTLLVDAL